MTGAAALGAFLRLGPVEGPRLVAGTRRLTGFRAVVDAIGGVTIDVPEPVYGPLYDPDTGGYEMIRIRSPDPRRRASPRLLPGPAGLLRLRPDGAPAVPARCHGRGSRTVGTLARLPELLEVVETHVATDLPLERVPDLVRVAGHVSAGEVRMVASVRAGVWAATAHGYHVPDVPLIRETARRTIDDPASAADLGVPTAAQACG